MPKIMIVAAIAFVMLSSGYAQTEAPINTFVWLSGDIFNQNRWQPLFIALDEGQIDYTLVTTTHPYILDDQHYMLFNSFIRQLSEHTNVLFRIDIGDNDQNKELYLYNDYWGGRCDPYIKILYDKAYWDLHKQTIRAYFEGGNIGYFKSWGTNNVNHSLEELGLNNVIKGYWWDFDEQYAIGYGGMHNYDFECSTSNWNGFNGYDVSIIENPVAKYANNTNNSWNAISQNIEDFSGDEPFDFSCEVFIHEGFQTVPPSTNIGPIIEIQYWYDDIQLQPTTYIDADDNITEETQYLTTSGSMPTGCNAVVIVVYGRGRGFVEFDNFKLIVDGYNRIQNPEFDDGWDHWDGNWGGDWSILYNKKARYHSITPYGLSFYQIADFTVYVPPGETARVDFRCEIFIHDDVTGMNARPFIELEYYDYYNPTILYPEVDWDLIWADLNVKERTQVLKGSFYTPYRSNGSLISGCSRVKVNVKGNVAGTVDFDRIEYMPNPYNGLKRAYYALEPTGTIDWKWTTATKTNRVAIKNWIAERHAQAENQVITYIKTLDPDFIKKFFLVWDAEADLCTPLRHIDLTTLNENDAIPIFWKYDSRDYFEYPGSEYDKYHSSIYSWCRAWQRLDPTRPVWYMGGSVDWHDPYTIREFGSYAYQSGMPNIGWYYYSMDLDDIIQTEAQKASVIAVCKQLNELKPYDRDKWSALTGLDINLPTDDSTGLFNTIPNWSSSVGTDNYLFGLPNTYAWGYDDYDVTENAGVIYDPNLRAYDINYMAHVVEDFDLLEDVADYDALHGGYSSNSLCDERSFISRGKYSIKKTFTTSEAVDLDTAGLGTDVVIPNPMAGGEWTIDLWVKDPDANNNDEGTDINDVIEKVEIILKDDHDNKMSWFANNSTGFYILNNFRYSFMFGVDMRTGVIYVNNELLQANVPDIGFDPAQIDSLIIQVVSTKASVTTSFFIDNLIAESFGSRGNGTQDTGDNNPVLALYGVMPNPSVKPITIKYSLSTSCYVNVSICDIAGRQIRTLVSQEQKSGVHSINWDAFSDKKESMPNGIYFVNFQAGEYKDCRKFVYIK